MEMETFSPDSPGKPIHFDYPDDQLFHALMGTRMAHLLLKLERAGLVAPTKETSIDAIGAILDQECDKLVEIFRDGRAFNADL